MIPSPEISSFRWVAWDHLTLVKTAVLNSQSLVACSRTAVLNRALSTNLKTREEEWRICLSLFTKKKDITIRSISLTSSFIIRRLRSHLRKYSWDSRSTGTWGQLSQESTFLRSCKTWPRTAGTSRPKAPWTSRRGKCSTASIWSIWRITEDSSSWATSRSCNSSSGC